MKPWLSRKLPLPFIGLLTFFTANAISAPIPTDLTIDGTVAFNTSLSLPASGSATQGGDMTAYIGGVNTISVVDNVTVTGDNPLGGVFVDFDDGVEINAGGSGDANSAVGDLIFDIAFDLTNSSLTSDYQIFFEVEYFNFVNADGTDAYIDAEINLFDNGLNEFFASDLTSDTVFGDSVNGTDLPTSGDSQLDAGIFEFDITLTAGTSDFFTGLVKIDGEDFGGDGSFFGNAEVWITVVDAVELNADVPEPSVFTILLSGLLLLSFRHRLTSFTNAKD
ncbi:hypothetical protein [Alteromonas sp. ASW11-130]|uniref:hypothetical protein n=1 Tax=Alteromonas sp. ASW11-130 TaxID=3015775 RepID=UPI0022426972|nr:hypothetical protein [Alteromonas sp. ASW11-130]MCW8092722.1 hypothetical protein [Alteromonas sp. ASW11-130]